LPDAACHFVYDHIVVRRVPAQQTTDANNRVIFPSLGERASSQRNLKSPRHTNQRDIPFLRARAQQPVVSTQKKPLRDERIEACDNNSEPFSRSAKSAFDSRNSWLGRAFDFYFFFRFSLRSRRLGGGFALFSFKRRRPLFQKRCRPFLLVLSRAAHSKQRRF